MNIVILHCHLERGGVTQVIENHVRSLSASGRVANIVLACGDRTSGITAATRQAVAIWSIPELDYDRLTTSDTGTAPSCRARAIAMADALTERLSKRGMNSDETILHWHNHSLGKNASIPGTVAELSKRGFRQLLQIHDFAEDNRPENLLGLIQASGATSKRELDDYLYPTATGTHYAALTRADASVLVSIGIPDAQTHWLPNSVGLPTGSLPDPRESLVKVRAAMGLPSDARWALYPVRGIRRKNVGEWLLLSLWMPPDVYSGLTLTPTTPVEKASYLRWKSVAASFAPRAVFDAGEHEEVSFAENLSACDRVVSTSVAEGFGMTFLEPWLAHREVIARRLPTVTDDFEHSGVRLPKSYDRLPIPGPGSAAKANPWIAECRKETSLAREQAWSSVGPEFRPTHQTQAPTDSTIDFAELTCNRQIEVLSRIADDDGYRRDVEQSCARVIEDLAAPPDADTIAANAGVIAQEYSIERAGRRLVDIYEQIIGEDMRSVVNRDAGANAAIDQVHRVRPYFPCRTEILSS